MSPVTLHFYDSGFTNGCHWWRSHDAMIEEPRTPNSTMSLYDNHQRYESYDHTIWIFKLPWMFEYKLKWTITWWQTNENQAVSQKLLTRLRSQPWNTEAQDRYRYKPRNLWVSLLSIKHVLGQQDVEWGIETRKCLKEHITSLYSIHIPKAAIQREKQNENSTARIWNAE